MSILDAPGMNKAYVDGGIAGAKTATQNISQSVAVCYSILSNGISTSTTYREPHVFTNGGYDIRLVYANAVTTATSQNATGLGTVTVTAALEYGANFYPVTFQGQPSGAMLPGAVLISDPIPVDIAIGDTAYIRSCPTVTAGQKWNSTHFGTVTGSSSAINVDLTQGVGALANPGAGIHFEGAQFGPVGILGGRDRSGKKSVVLIGDSILQGTGDGTPIRNVLHRGFGVRGMGFNSVFMAQAIPSTKAVDRLVQSNFPMFVGLYSSSTACLSNFGTNDLATGTTAAVLEGYILSFAKLFKARGTQFYQTTLVPKVVTTDFCATVANQTLTSAGENTQRIAFNTWLRAGCPVDANLNPTTPGSAVYHAGDAQHPITGVIEVANTLEVNAAGVLTQDGGFWQCSGVVDSGTATGYNNQVLTDTTKNWAVNVYQGRVVVLAGTAPINVVSNTATTLTLGANVSAGSVPANGSTPTYSIINTTNCGDGIHPGMAGHIAMSAPVATWYAALR